MVSVQIDGEWTQVDDRLLIEMILDGRAEELTPARDSTRAITTCPLVELLQPPHLEALAHRIVQCLPGMYTTGPDAVDLGVLLDRVGQLRGWNWPDHLIKGRLEWLHGWLSELAGSFERAVKSYDAYLRGLSQEPALRLLAYNNRGVLRIRLRQSEGVKDIARAAICADNEGGSDGITRLPAACLNLLNLLTHTLNRHPLCDQIEDALVDFMVDLPRRVRERSIGPDSYDSWDTDEADSDVQGPDRDVLEELPGADWEGPTDDLSGGAADDQDAERRRLRKRLKILNDPTFIRLNRLIVHLADEAARVSPALDAGCTPDAVASQLRLWTMESSAGMEEPGQLMDALAGQRRRRNQLDGCAEAASLLYAADIPSSLVPGDGSISWVRQYTDKAIGLVEEYCVNADYRLAENTLRSLSSALEKHSSDPLIDAVRQEVAQRTAEVQHRAQAHEQLDLYQTCTDLVRQVKEFCTETELCRAEGEAEILLRRVKQAAERLAGMDAVEGDAAPLLSDLPERVERHLNHLQRLDIEQRVVKPRERLHASCPQDWREPVPRETYEALRICQINDPAGLVEDWRTWRLRLDKHQARHHFRQVLQDVTEGQANGPEAEAMLAQALGFDPQLTPASAPLYCMLALRKQENQPEDLVRTKADILRTARELLQLEPLGPESLWSPAVRTGLVEEACVLLERLIQAYHGVGAELDDLWQALERGLAPAFAEAPPQVLREIHTVVDRCLAACPVHSGGKRSSIDPRNRLHVLQQTCDRVILTAEGEEALRENRSRDAQERFEKTIEATAGGGSMSDQEVQLLRRAACGLYLARFGRQDPAHRQRNVLDQIDRWADRAGEAGWDTDCSVKYVETMIADARERAGKPGHPGDGVREGHGPGAHGDVSDTEAREM